MSTFVESSKSHNGIPIYLWPNLLSLDAPLIAVLWQLLLAQAVRVRTGWREPVALFCAVWTIYIADRLFDVLRPMPAGWEPERKKFYRRHRIVMAAIGISSGLCAILLALFSPLIHSFLLGAAILSVCVLSYFGAVHAQVLRKGQSWPRELTVSVIFSIGTFLPIAFFHRATVQVAACAALFALLCWVNTSVIESEEWYRNRQTRQPGFLARFIRAHERWALLLIVLLSVSCYLCGFMAPQFCVSVLAACAVLFFVALLRARVSPPLFRAAMDGALCSPAVLLFLHYLG